MPNWGIVCACIDLRGSCQEELHPGPTALRHPIVVVIEFRNTYQLLGVSLLTGLFVHSSPSSRIFAIRSMNMGPTYLRTFPKASSRFRTNLATILYRMFISPGLWKRLEEYSRLKKPGEIIDGLTGHWSFPSVSHNAIQVILRDNMWEEKLEGYSVQTWFRHSGRPTTEELSAMAK